MSKRKLLVLVVAVIALAALGWLLHEEFSLAALAEREQHVRRAVDTHPWRSAFWAFGIYFAMSLIPGTSGKSIVCGWLFGFWRGVLIVDAGLTAAATLSFLLSRYLFFDAFQQRFERRVERLHDALQREGAFCLLALRMMHVPYTLVNYTAGATSLPLRTFAWTTAVGMLPGIAVFVFLGSRLPGLDQLLEHGAGSLLDPWLVSALVASAVLPFAIRAGAKWLSQTRRATEQGHC